MNEITFPLLHRTPSELRSLADIPQKPHLLTIRSRNNTATPAPSYYYGNGYLYSELVLLRPTAVFRTDTPGMPWQSSQKNEPYSVLSMTVVR